MVRITIELEQTRENLKRREGRLLHFPDGIQRIIALPRRYWLKYDMLSERWVYPGLYEDACFEMAYQYGKPGDVEFDKGLECLFGLAIEAGVNVLSRDTYNVANKN